MNPTDRFLNVGLKKLCVTTIMIYGDLLKESVPKACDEVCRYKKNRKCTVNTWW